jgi:DNA processing protein
VTPTACNDCLRRAWLVRDLAGHIETAIEKKPGGRARDLLALENRDLAEALARGSAPAVLATARGRDPAEMREAIDLAGAWTCCLHHPAYPAQLRPMADQPATLFGLGDPELLGRLDEPVVTVVGARRASAYGRGFATDLGRELAVAGLPVISGMALGIDSCAHRGALDAGGLTAAVLGSGVDVPHPARMRKLYEEIVENGLVLSELPPGTRPWRWTFPARNRIMAALAAMTVVVEARERSGSLITSEMASDLGREVGAVPGQVGGALAAGTNNLLRDGAHVIRRAEDVLDTLIDVGSVHRSRAVEPPRGPALDAALATMLEIVERGASTPDAVARVSGQPGRRAVAALARLELMGYVAADGSGRYSRTTLAGPT